MQETPEHKDLRETVRRFVENEINPYADQWDEAGAFPAHELFKKLGGLGLLGISKPVAFGGLGLDYSYEVIFAEEIGAAHAAGVPLGIGVQSNMATPALARYGSDALREAFLVPAIAGEKVASIAVSEPHAGSDVAAIRTTAREDGGDYVISGQKMWITNATQADFFCVLANTGGDDRHGNKSLFIVPSELPGVSAGTRLKKIGMRASDTAPVFFEDVRVPKSYRIGEEGRGFTYQMQQFQEERLFGAAMAVKALELCVSSTIDYTRDRKAFGQSILDNQIVHFALAEMQTEIEALRALLYRATAAFVAGEDVTLLASMAKLKAGRLTRTIPDQCLQFWGGMGFVEETLINRLYRDMRLVPIGGGADEVMQGIICKLMGIAPARGCA
ncbi:acyl-CoA dehydrogenase family protein [Sedimentitalea sp. JM2-8]|uniref:Acyl-CoA dehydrogenase family protein n=1 Tax=Sedimentitalea xiamensis TaxID=3050037 RepID=A0ABT7F9W2_9RHOB|nr:acyl-CoA dehydrogenase family protein [Sedimentitalea xiamensis]MDK3071823.1 acyl-CoA dehydrogenase family protein [Sedimentitalea xiamensis]